MDQLQIQTTNLIAANRSSIKTFGKQLLKIWFAYGHEISHRFWIQTVTRPMLGANFFSSHGLMIDLPRRRLVSSSRTYRGNIDSFPFHMRAPAS